MDHAIPSRDYRDLAVNLALALVLKKEGPVVYRESFGPAMKGPADQAIGDLLHMYGWVIELNGLQERYLFNQREKALDFVRQGRSIEEVTSALFSDMPQNLGKIVMRDNFADKYQPQKGSYASFDDTRVILERIYEEEKPHEARRGKREISLALRRIFKDLKNKRMRKENYENI